MVSQSVIQKFRESLRGQTFCPGDAGYDVARAVPNAMIDRHPAIIARCADSDDVIACVRFARDQQRDPADRHHDQRYVHGIAAQCVRNARPGEPRAGEAEHDRRQRIEWHAERPLGLAVSGAQQEQRNADEKQE